MSSVRYDFSGERYVVTGASSGIGRRVALDLAKCGAEVLSIARNPDRLESLRCECPERIFTASLDVCDSDSLEAAISGFVESHGKLDGGVHSAGIDFLTPLRNSTGGGGGHEIMSVSFWAGIELLRLITNPSYGKHKTSTVLFSSAASLTCDKGKFVYSAAKSAVNSAVENLSHEISEHGHRVNSVLPGWVDTPMTQQLSINSDIDSVLARQPLGIGKPEYVSNAVLFLLSDDASCINGKNFVVDGGYSS